ncbi:tumor necrosis factor receptor superfamily member 5-like isoform X1 [Oreochromis niloticus]|uniref:tumor necrosis factor receptor superfamily member 5-like isoform X1 n=1 Tax=Oreochromis niloticus TaxID=8128 RepID=UPI000DF355C9|nr:tumor necrosis factor receptor superfamily member 5-like isoform X1 [Oreochromis niloticus]
MVSALLIFGYAAVFIVPVLSCRPKEYKTNDGWCCPTCNEGRVVQRDCTAFSGTQCHSCDLGTFMNQTNSLYNCFPCTSCDTGHGLFVKQNCTATTDTVCDVLNGYHCKDLIDNNRCSLAEKHSQCAAGQRIKEPGTSRTDTVCDVLNGYHCKGLIDSNGCSLAEKHSQCAAGQRIKEPGTSTSDTVCEDCEPGFFSKDGVNCTAWTICSESQIIVEEGNSTSDVVCGSAPRHRYGLISFVVLFLIIAICLVITGIVKACKYHLTSVKSAHSAQHLQSLTC